MFNGSTSGLRAYETSCTVICPIQLQVSTMLHKKRTCALTMAAFAFTAAELNDPGGGGGGGRGRGFCRGQTSSPSPEEEGNLSCERVQNCKALGGSQSPSIAIRDSNGRLGNQMFVYQLLLSLRMQFGYRTFITRRVSNSQHF